MINTLNSSVGKKIIVAVTGFLLLGFVVAHMLGNLQVFLGPEAINAYAMKLRSLGELLWVMRIGLLVIFVTHIVFAISVSNDNRSARPVGYAKSANIQSSYASRFMVFSGLLILIYVIYHLAHFTLGVAHSEHFHYTDPEGNHDVYAMIIGSFQNPAVSAVYLAAMVALCFHLRQAAAAFPQTLGLLKSGGRELADKIGTALALIVFLGFSAIPVAVLLGILKMPEYIQ